MDAVPAPAPERALGASLLVLLALLAERGARASDESEERYRLLVEQSPEPIAVHQHGRIAYANRAAAALLGAPEPASLHGRPVLELVAPGSRRAVRERIERLYATGEPLPFEERSLVGVDGRRLRVEIAAARVRWEGAHAVQLVAVDVTARRRAEGEARRRAARRSDMERVESLGRLAGELAREFGALLAETVGGADELLGELPHGSPYAARLRDVRRSALNACRLADRLGTLAEGDAALGEPVHLSGLCAESGEALQAASLGAELSFDLAAALPPVRCNVARLRRALLDLGHFAARRAGAGGSVSLRTGVRRLDAAWVAGARGGARAGWRRHVFVELRDDGPPLTPAQRAQLFEAFPRDSALAPGTALAGALASVRPYGGLVRAEPARPRGLRVTLTLPVAPARPRRRSRLRALPSS